jgi:hypothetical protein
MAENKTRPTAMSVAEFIETSIDAPRRADAEALVRLMRTATGEEPKMWGPSIIGFGSTHYRYESGREGDEPLIGFAPRKAAFVLYNATRSGDSAELLAKLGKHSRGKGCLNIKKLADVDRKVLEAMIAASVDAMRRRKPS